MGLFWHQLATFYKLLLSLPPIKMGMNQFQGNKLTKWQRLYGKKTIGSLFESGSFFFQFPFKIVYSFSPEAVQGANLRFLISVSVRNFKHATDRNKIKRQTREAWRKNKFSLEMQLFESKLHLNVALIFTSKIILTTSEVETKVTKIIERLKQHHEVYKVNPS